MDRRASARTCGQLGQEALLADVLLDLVLLVDALLDSFAGFDSFAGAVLLDSLLESLLLGSAGEELLLVPRASLR